jgi:hypothetical protein
LPNHDALLSSEIANAKKRGISERGAVQLLAADDGKRALFPYSPQRQRHHTQLNEIDAFKEALRARWRLLKEQSKQRHAKRLNAVERRRADEFVLLASGRGAAAASRANRG